MLDYKKLFTKILTALQSAKDASYITSGILPAARGGTGLSSIARFLKGEVSSDDLNGDANNAPYMSAVYISNTTTAASISNLPGSYQGHLITLGGTNQRGYQFFFLHDHTKIWVRRQSTTWTSWSLMFDSAPSFTAPTMTSGRATRNSGGYYKVGKRVYVELSITSTTARASGSGVYGFASGFPVPLLANVPLLCSVGNKAGAMATITSNGTMNISNQSIAIASNDVIIISGSYLAAS